MQRFIAAVVAVVISAGLVACGDDESGGSGAASGGEEGGKIEKIGLTVADVSNPFYIALKEGVEAKAEEIGASVEVEDGQQDLNRQSQQFDDFVQRGVDVILVTAVDTAGIAPAVKRAKDAGVTVIAVDIGAEGGVDASINSDNVDAGRQACKYLVEKLGGEGNVAILDGPPTDTVDERRDTCKEEIAKASGIKIVAEQKGDGSREQGRSITTDMLTAHPEINAVFAIGDPLGLGAELALKQAKRDDVFVVAVDGAPEVVDSMKGGGLFAASSAQQPREIGAKGVEIAADIAAGNPPSETTIKIPIQLVTKENVDSYGGW
jgi:ribose transport system substrate-binding protein